MVNNRLYKEETGFLLNYLTLQIEDKEVAAQLRNHRTQQYETVMKPLIIPFFIMYAYQILAWVISRKGNPFSLITGGLTFLFILLLIVLKFKNKLYLACYL